MRHFAAVFGIHAGMRILDVGGTELNWRLLDETPQVVLLNLPQDTAVPTGPNFLPVAGDGCRLPFADQSFDLVFSNSVIEHVGGAAEQAAFAREIARVGRYYWVQTPDRRFPVEPHLFTPGLHLLPGGLRRRLARWCTFWSLVERPSPDRWEYYIRHCTEEMRLLSAAEMRGLFPGAELVRERLLGWSRALIAVRR
jgi:hypothetical protein